MKTYIKDDVIKMTKLRRRSAHVIAYMKNKRLGVT